jgi:hypothetical protein
MIRAPCCNEVYSCRHCHKEAMIFDVHLHSFFLCFHIKNLVFLLFSDLGLCYFHQY